MRSLSLILLLLLLFAAPPAKSQVPQLSDAATVSLLTCGPGPEVFTYFGHSALRVTDPALRLDRVYNYGTFDFDIPNFYGQFIDGKLWYMLSVVRFQGFIPDYMAEDRFIKELRLNLPPGQLQELFNLLETNALPENKHYWYDFFLDNCSTRVRDIVAKAAGGTLVWPPEPAEHLTYRDLIMPYIGLNRWARTGILLMLAGGADREATQQGYMFLPDHMHRLFQQAQLADGTPLCETEQQLYLPEYPKPKGNGILHPYIVFSLILLTSLFLTLYRKVPAWLRKTWITVLLTASGLFGFVLAYMWLFSGHLVCHANINLAWAMPFNLFLAIALWFPKLAGAAAWYSRIALVPLGGFLLTFWLWKQKVPPEAILFSLALLPCLARLARFKILGYSKADDQAN
jgi:hypothetical protein